MVKTDSSFKLSPGTVLADKYEVLRKIGSGYEAEVYRVRELGTGVERAAKLFFPHRDVRNRAVRFAARKLHRLRNCKVIVQYHTRETVYLRGQRVNMLVSELVEGEMLSQYVRRQPGRRLQPFEAAHLLYALAKGLACIHAHGEYHGDIHDGNIMIRRRGVGFDVWLVDVYNQGADVRDNQRFDVVETVRVFYEVIGGPKQYASMPQYVKDIVRGMRKSLITQRFRTMQSLVQWLRSFSWA